MLDFGAQSATDLSAMPIDDISRTRRRSRRGRRTQSAETSGRSCSRGSASRPGTDADRSPRSSDPDRLAHADRRAEQTAEQCPDRPHAVIDEPERAVGTGTDPVGGSGVDDRADVDIEDHHAETGHELGPQNQGEDREHRHVRLGQRNEDERERGRQRPSTRPGPARSVDQCATRRRPRSTDTDRNRHRAQAQARRARRRGSWWRTG